MTCRRILRHLAAGAISLAMVSLSAHGTMGQILKAVQTSSPTYAIPLKDGSVATVWWDAVGNPAHPEWRCEVPGQGGTGSIRTILPLTAQPGDWEAALAEAKALLKGRVADGD